MATTRAPIGSTVAVLCLLVSICTGLPNRFPKSTYNQVDNVVDATKCQTCQEEFTETEFQEVTGAMSDSSASWRDLPSTHGKLQRFDTPTENGAAIKARLCFTVPAVAAHEVTPFFSYTDKRLGCDATLQARLLETCPTNHLFYSVQKFSPSRLDRDFLQLISLRLDRKTGCTTIAHKSASSIHAIRDFPADTNNVVIRGTVNPSGVQVCPAAGGQNTDVCMLVNYDIKEQVTSDVADSIAQNTLSRWYTKVTECLEKDTSATPGSSSSSDPIPKHAIPHKAVEELIASEKDIQGWLSISDSPKASTYFKHWAGTTTYAFKSFYNNIAIPPCTLMKIITDYNSRATWDPTFPRVEILQKNDNTHLIHWLLQLPNPFINRDVILYSTIKPLPSGGHVIVYINAKHTPRPEQAGIIRATAYPSAIFIHPHPDDPVNLSQISYNMHMDLGKDIRKSDYMYLLQGREMWVMMLEQYYNNQVTNGKLSDIHSSYVDVKCN